MGLAMKLIGYVRVSTEQQAESGLGLEAQRKRLAQYADLFDHEIVLVEEDAGVSAKSTDRPGLQRCLDRLNRGEAEGMLIAKLDRLTRHVADLCTLLDTFRDGGWALMSVADQLDTSSASGRMVIHILGVISQWERETIGERTREALLQLKAMGVRLGSPSLGERRGKAAEEGKRRPVEIDAEETVTLGWIARAKIDGMTVRDIAAELNARGTPTKRGGRWHATTVQRVLSRAIREAK